MTKPREGQRESIQTTTRLLIHDLELRGDHGVYPEERTSGGRFSIDLELDGDFAEAIRTDSIEASVDVDQVVALVREQNRQTTYTLIESFADAIGRALLKRFPLLTSARVRVTKKSLPRLDGVGCWTAEVTQQRP